MNCNHTQQTPLEQSLQELFEMFEHCALDYLPEIPSISKTIFDSDYYLEISDEQHFLKLIYENISQPPFEAIVELDYTAKDLKPLKGKIITQKTFIGLIEKLYLLNNKWYYLNPQKLINGLTEEELELNAQNIKEKFLSSIFSKTI